MADSVNPLVSILIPAHNAEQWIGDTIRSAMNQTWKKKEIIVVDDGSTDRTLEIARRFEGEFVRVVTQRNQGGAAARNNAFSLSRGDYIQWLDSDDLLAPDKIARQIESLDEHCTGRTLLSASFGRFMYRTSRVRFTATSLWCDLTPSEFLLRKLEQRVYMQTAVWLVSRELTEAAGPWDTRMVYDDDGEYFCRVMMASDGIRFVSEAKVLYRDVGTSRTSHIGRSNRKLEALWLSMQLHIQYLQSLENTERARAACLTHLQNYLIFFYGCRHDIVAKIQARANELGGRLTEPQLPWKFAWIRKLLGWEAAQRVQLVLRAFKWSVLRFVDEWLFKLEVLGESVLGFRPKSPLNPDAGLR